MKRYTYKSKKTGKVVTSDKPVKDADLVLVSRIADGSMKGSARVRTK